MDDLSRGGFRVGQPVQMPDGLSDHVFDEAMRLLDQYETGQDDGDPRKLIVRLYTLFKNLSGGEKTHD